MDRSDMLMVGLALALMFVSGMIIGQRYGCKVV